MPVGGEDAAGLVLIAPAQGRGHRDPTGEGDVALAVEQALAGQVHGGQRGGAGGLHGDTGTLEAELVRGPGGQEVLVAAEQDLVHARRVQDGPVVHQVEHQVRVEARPGEDTDAALEALGVDSGRLQGLPGAFEEDPVLRVHDLRLAGAVAEEALVEQVGVREEPLGPDVVVPLQQCGVDPGQLVVGEGRDAFPARREVGPEGLDVRGAREAARHADDGHPFQVALLLVLRL